MWEKLTERFTQLAETWNDSWVIYLLQLITFTVLFYLVFKVLKQNKGGKIIALVCVFVILLGASFCLAEEVTPLTVLVVSAVLLLALMVITMFSVEIKRNMLDSGAKHHIHKDDMTVSHIENIINETIRAVQHMSKNDIGALIVLSNENLPDSIISSGTVIDADINAPMIEAVFYPKAPLHDGAMIIEGHKIHAAGCFLPLIQNDNLPQEVGSRHRAALGVTAIASVTAIVVSEETGIISIVKNGEIKKRYANDGDLKNALSDYYWSDLTAED